MDNIHAIEGRHSNFPVVSLAKSNPWDVLAPSSYGDTDPNTTYAAVGRALTAWEELELDLARLYAAFLGLPPKQAVADPRYRDATVFRHRLDEINRAAEHFFFRRPCQEHENEYRQLTTAAIGFSCRRNEIAHGRVNLYRVRGAEHGSEIERNYMLMPSWYRAKDFEFVDPTNPYDIPSPMFLYTAAEIDAYAGYFVEWCPRILAFAQLLRRLLP